MYVLKNKQVKKFCSDFVFHYERSHDTNVMYHVRKDHKGSERVLWELLVSLGISPYDLLEKAKEKKKRGKKK